MPHETLPCPSFAPGDAGYEAARRAASWNARLPDRFPDLIVHARDAQDAAAAVRLAIARGWRIGVRSGGHSWPANHLRDGGMLLDLSRLKAMEIDEAAMTARVGPGVTGDQVNAALAQRRLFFPVGHCKGVGLGGYLLQGGFGWNSRALGMACENVLGIDYIGADGLARHASATENSDIFWAARGAGPGFFGVVTRYHLKLHRRPRVIGAKVVSYGVDQFETLCRWAHRIGPDVPASIELMLILSRHTPGVEGPGVTVIAPVFADSFRQAWRDLGFMKTLPKGARRKMPFLPIPLSKLTAASMTHYPSDHNFAVDNMWTGADIEALAPGLRRIAETLPPAPAHMLWMNWRPPASRPDMAYSLEDQVYIALYGAWQGKDESHPAAGWAQEHMAGMSHLSTGIQLADENLGRRPAPFLAAANMARLDALRARHDPDGRFHPYMGRIGQAA